MLDEFIAIESQMSNHPVSIDTKIATKLLTTLRTSLFRDQLVIPCFEIWSNIELRLMNPCDSNQSKDLRKKLNVSDKRFATTF